MNKHVEWVLFTDFVKQWASRRHYRFNLDLCDGQTLVKEGWKRDLK